MGNPQPGSDIAVGRQNRTNSRDDLQKFVEKAALNNMAEIELGQLAQSRAQDPEVKQFAQMMIDTHTKAQTELQQAASSSGITVPSSLDEKHQKAQQKLSNLNGAEFDREYMKLMVKSHKDTQKLLENRVRNASLTESAGVSGSSGSAASGGTSGSGTETTSGTSGTSGSATETAGTSGSGSVSASASAGSSASIDSWASSTLSEVQQHLQQAQDLEKRIKDSGKSDKSQGDRNDK
jgi:putative membrane protein